MSPKKSKKKLDHLTITDTDGNLILTLDASDLVEIMAEALKEMYNKSTKHFEEEDDDE